ncbi:MAG: hypothetical protein JST01_11135 [Cyanobacteria bacterium SZAS TMP-1]|nr:hypothetical protein [Cyanobacteria bacterium SZAS TMP-1]
MAHPEAYQAAIEAVHKLDTHPGEKEVSALARQLNEMSPTELKELSRMLPQMQAADMKVNPHLPKLSLEISGYASGNAHGEATTGQRIEMTMSTEQKTGHAEQTTVNRQIYTRESEVNNHYAKISDIPGAGYEQVTDANGVVSLQKTHSLKEALGQSAQSSHTLHKSDKH